MRPGAMRKEGEEDMLASLAAIFLVGLTLAALARRGFSYGEAKAAVSEVLAQLEAEGCEL